LNDHRILYPRSHVRFSPSVSWNPDLISQKIQAKRVFAAPETNKGKADLVIDATGVSLTITDIFSKRGRSFTAVKIHGGDAEIHDKNIHRVPKGNLVFALQAALQNGALKIASSLELAENLREELLNFRIKINLATGHDSHEHRREGDHDDLALAAALTVWAARTARDDLHLTTSGGSRMNARTGPRAGYSRWRRMPTRSSRRRDRSGASSHNTATTMASKGLRLPRVRCFAKPGPRKKCRVS
jgi:hypothetical protein